MVAMLTKMFFFNIFLLIMIGLDYTVIMMYYMPYYMLPLMYESSKNLQKGPKMAKKADLSNFDRFHGNKTYFPR